MWLLATAIVLLTSAFPYLCVSFHLSSSRCACAGPYGFRLFGVTKANIKSMDSVIMRDLPIMKGGVSRISMGYDWTDREVDYVVDALGLASELVGDLIFDYECDVHSGDYRCKRRSADASYTTSLDDFDPFVQATNSKECAPPAEVSGFEKGSQGREKVSKRGRA